jgi:hypothetical protein
MYVFFPILFYSGSKQNEHKRTYDGVDVMGERLTNEVCQCLFMFMTFSNYELRNDTTIP